MTKLFKKYSELLDGGKYNTTYLTESEIITLKSRIGMNKCSLTDDEVWTLKERVLYQECEYNIHPEHAQKGIDYLRSKCFKLNGKQRNTKQVQNMPKEFFEAIRKYDHFTFVGFEEISYNAYSSRYFYMPVWRIHTTDGQLFDYYMNSQLEFEHTGEWTIENKLKLVK